MIKQKLFIAAFFLAFVTPHLAFARCMTERTWVSPSQNTSLPSNATLLVTFYGQDQAAFKKSASKKIYFRSGKHKVEAKIVEQFVSDYHLTVIKIEASLPLKKGRKYSLKIIGKRFKWKIKKEDRVKPIWVSKPKLQGFKKITYGCGPSRKYKLTLKVEDETPVFYKIKMTSQNGKVQQFLMAPEKEGEITIGHGMCSGEFVPPEDKATNVELTPYDFAGNKGETLTIKLTP